MSTCPNCAAERGAGSECPRCGVVFDKWRPRVDPRALEPPDEDAWIEEPVPSLWSRAVALVVTPRAGVTSLEFAGHAVAYGVFFLWGWRFVLLDYRGGEIAGSFMHNVNLVFHEAGHVLFRPFGDFMTVLGGSLCQLLVPLVVAAGFLLKNRDPFAASLGVWWLGQSFKDLAPYIYDASRLVMPLLGGVTGADRPGYHDWNNILRRFDMLWADHIVAKWANRTGTALILAFMVWGGYVLYREYRNLGEESPE
jgi:hypothetical protein